MTDRHVLEQQLKALANEEARALDGDLFLVRLQAARGGATHVFAEAPSTGLKRPLGDFQGWRLLAALGFACMLLVVLWVTLTLFESASAHWAEALGGGSSVGLPAQPWNAHDAAWTRAVAEHLAGLTLCAWIAGCLWWMARSPVWGRLVPTRPR